MWNTESKKKYDIPFKVRKPVPSVATKIQTIF